MFPHGNVYLCSRYPINDMIDSENEKRSHAAGHQCDRFSYHPVNRQRRNFIMTEFSRCIPVQRVQSLSSRAQNFLSSFNYQNFSPNGEPLPPGREPIHHILIGSPRVVTSSISTLQRLGYAEVGLWSRLLPSPNPGEVMSILTRYITVQ